MFLAIVAVNTDYQYTVHLLFALKEMMPCEVGNEYIYIYIYIYIHIHTHTHTHTHTQGYARTNVIGSRTSFVVASVRSSIHLNICI